MRESYSIINQNPKYKQMSWVKTITKLHSDQG